MNEYISKEAVVDAGYLFDWYISSVGDEPPVWTDAHIDELLNDFIVIPKDTKAADVQPVKRGKWVYYKNNGIWDIHKCTVCNTPFELPMDVVASSVFCYCPHCGADMRGHESTKG